MKMEKPFNYTLEEIKHYWNTYTKMSGIRYLQEGKWHYDFSGKVKGLINATRAERVTLQKVMPFPKFLEKYGKKT